MKQTDKDQEVFHTQHAQVGLSITRQILMVSIQVELYDDVLDCLQERTLNMLQKHALKGLLLDLSHVPLLDYETAQRLEKILAMAKLLGAYCVIVGIQPNVAACMVHWNHRWQGMQIARNLDDGFSLLDHALCLNSDV
ncbi:MAG: STAS domain-containing protein [Zetaproteobacteria bacterium]|nr:STAS domain-containing protein [Zetaproteobacteria bacterium]